MTVNGLFRPFALAGGRAAAVWRIVDGKVVVEPFGRLSRTTAAALERDAEDVVRYLALA